MRHTTRLLALAALAAATWLAGAVPAARAGDALTLQAGSSLWLTGTSTVHDYSAKATKLEVTFRSDPARWPANVTGTEAIEGLIRAGGVSGTDVTVGVTGLKSGKDGLDKNMYKALLAAEHPEIRFRLEAYQVGEADTSGLPIRANGFLTVAGVERPVSIAATVRRDGETLRLRAEVPLLMSQFGVKPPKMMLGTIKTADKVVVHFDLRIAADQTQPSASGTE
jgi:polyisoprenoid-binding protein YceI